MTTRGTPTPDDQAWRSGLRVIASEHGDAAILQIRMGIADGAYISARAAASYALSAMKAEGSPPTPGEQG